MPAGIVSALTTRWRSSGIDAGDLVLVHSSLRRTLREMSRAGFELSVENVLESLLDTVGASGTLLLPLFNFSFTKGTPFDIRSTPSEMGALTEAARRYPDAIRTGHPIYSFAVIGASSGAFANVDNVSGYASDSPFGILREMNGKIAVIDLPDQNSMTFYHHVEEMHLVPYRFFKDFQGKYTSWNGEVSDRTYKLFVRDLDAGVQTHVNPAGEMMWEKGIYRGSRPYSGSGMRVARASDVYKHTAWLIESGQAEGNLFVYEK